MNNANSAFAHFNDADAASASKNDAKNTSITRMPPWMNQIDATDFSLQAVIGGWRGIIESSLPAVIFIALFVTVHSLRFSLIGAGLCVVLFLLVRLIQRQRLTQVFSGFFGVAIGLVWAAFSGRGENFFAWGLITSAFFAFVLLATILFKRPAVALFLGFLWNLPRHWYKDSNFARLRIRSLALTWLWAGMFIFRLLVQIPLWHSGAVGTLGTAKLILGLPLFSLVCWITWLILKPFFHLNNNVSRSNENNPEDNGAGILS